MNEHRIYGNIVEIDSNEVKTLYAKRSVKSETVHIDAPTVLSSDSNLKDIELWNKRELEAWFPYLKLDDESIVFELGFGTGRMTQYITPIAKIYKGIDYVEEFKNIVLKRENIIKKDTTTFLSMSLKQFLEKEKEQGSIKFNRFFLSGGVFMYINDAELQKEIGELTTILDEKCIIYISEPIAMMERLTLNDFYSDTISDHYSAIYRTEKEYHDLFISFYEKGFKLVKSEAFFEQNIRKQKETQQWIFILER